MQLVLRRCDCFFRESGHSGDGCNRNLDLAVIGRCQIQVLVTVATRIAAASHITTFTLSGQEHLLYAAKSAACADVAFLM